MTRLLLLASIVAFVGLGCAAPGAAEDTDPVDEDEDVSECAIVSGGGGACPVDARLSQGFHGGHDGVDLANKIGTPIFAVMAGTVVVSGPAQGYGQWIRIKHDDGSMTEYGHMSRRFVQAGARVKAGQKIAAVGSEGRSTGPHLHLRTYRSASRTGSGNGMNPVEYLRARGVSLPCKARGVVDTKPAPAETEEGNDGESNGTVTAWKAANVHARSSTSAAVVGNVSANESFPATCWTKGDTVSSSGFSHDNWVKVTVDGKTGFISGVFLKGDETGDITGECP
jgi:hypothetical protein